MSDDRHIPGLALPRALLRVVGGSCWLFALLGLLQTAWSVIVVSLRSPFDNQTPFGLYFFICFVSVVVTIDMILLYCGYQLLRLRSTVVGLLFGVSLFSIAVFVSSGCLWTVADPKVSMSAGAATGIGLGGLAFLILSLFPIWAPALTLWAHRRLVAVPRRRIQLGLCAHCGYDLHGNATICPECGLDVPQSSSNENA
jgi:hypothetical protein